MFLSVGCCDQNFMFQCTSQREGVFAAFNWQHFVEDIGLTPEADQYKVTFSGMLGTCASLNGDHTLSFLSESIFPASGIYGRPCFRAISYQVTFGLFTISMTIQPGNPPINVFLSGPGNCLWTWTCATGWITTPGYGCLGGCNGGVVVVKL